MIKVYFQSVYEGHNSDIEIHIIDFAFGHVNLSQVFDPVLVQRILEFSRWWASVWPKWPIAQNLEKQNLYFVSLTQLDLMFHCTYYYWKIYFFLYSGKNNIFQIKYLAWYEKNLMEYQVGNRVPQWFNIEKQKG